MDIHRFQWWFFEDFFIHLRHFFDHFVFKLSLSLCNKSIWQSKLIERNFFNVNQLFWCYFAESNEVFILFIDLQKGIFKICAFVDIGSEIVYKRRQVQFLFQLFISYLKILFYLFIKCSFFIKFSLIGGRTL